ncbi:DNA internalization-related competence protein ComEC/Rec2 [Ferrimonas balearica]|uniref:DNA internalization-related competence protein ComEC/Rec2 n=1 Tax=Ferrimonas balearica TaxID=44012 RepID=UPI0021BDC163|nr:DNA internalization-related competence protein ComEC/Rec2 [Ferrimonas balearica]
MNGFLLGWIAALLAARVWPDLLPLPLLLFSIPALALLRRYPILMGWVLGILLFHIQAYRLTHPERALATGPTTVVATVASLPTGDEIYQRSRWQVEAINGETVSLFWSDQIELGWYGGPLLAQGQRYRLDVVLKSPSGVLNQGGGNARRRLLAEGVVATGYVRQGQLVEDSRHWRGALADALAQQVAELPRGDLLRALVLGDRRGIGADRWEALRASGLIHLVAISGLHLSIVALWVLGVGQKVLPRIWPSPSGAGQGALWLLCAGLVVSYAALAGYALPTRRAAVMVLLVLVMLWRSREARGWELLLRAAALVLLLDPLAALGAGFWLSFGAVSILLLLNWWRPSGKGWWARGRHLFYLQLGLAIGMTLIQGMVLNLYSLQGVWTNLLVLPLFSLVILPLCLLSGALALFAPSFAPPFLTLADRSLGLITLVSDWALRLQTEWPWLGGGVSSRSGWVLMLLVVALALYRFRPWRGWPWQAGILALSVMVVVMHRPVGWQLHLVDVGQGLAAVIERQGRFLLYDTGSAFPSGYSYAERAVLPLLRERGADALDLLVISHGDNDHAGGQRAIERVLAPEATRGINARCSGEEHWQGLTLSWWRRAGANRGRDAGNNDSCTLRVGDGEHSLLLPGDIEALVEEEMVNQGVAAPVSVLVSPHHGSSTSSSEAWLAALNPALVLIPAGRGNRWGFPHASVLARYKALRAEVWVVGQEGQVTVHFKPGSAPEVLSQRRHRAPWWYNRH